MTIETAVPPSAPHDSVSMEAQEVMKRIQAGELIENMNDLFPEYREALRQTLYIAAQSEVTVLTWAYTAYETAPDIGAKVAISATIQDEIGHAHQQGMLLERFGTSVEDITFNVDPRKVKTLMIMQFPVKNYIEFCMIQALLDRAGRVTTKDIEENCSFAPYRRALRKINFEENFHVGHGARWTKFYWSYSPETREMVQQACDWIFPHGITWFGLPDALKTRKSQLDYRIRGWSNDTMRDMWLQSACQFATALGIKVPARFDEETNKWVLDCPYPMLCDPDARTWIWSEASWEETITQLKAGGPMNPSAHERLQREEWGASLW